MPENVAISDKLTTMSQTNMLSAMAHDYKKAIIKCSTTFSNI